MNRFSQNIHHYIGMSFFKGYKYVILYCSDSTVNAQVFHFLSIKSICKMTTDRRPLENKYIDIRHHTRNFVICI